MFSAGELNRFTKRDGIPHDARDEKASIFWSDVKEKVQADGFKDVHALYNTCKAFEYHSGALPLLLFNTVPKNYEKYKAAQQSIFKAISEQSPASGKIIIDSSKYPLRAWSLSRIFDKNISYIYLKRDPVSVVESFQKKDIEQPSKNRFMANLYLLGVNALSSRIIRKLSNSIKISNVKYSDLLQNPVTTLKQIETDLNVDLSDSIRLIESEQPLQIGFLFDGNRLRLMNHVLFKKNNTGDKRPVTIIDHIFYPLHRFFWFK